MASQSRVPADDERGAGGKMPRRRRAEPSASPYLRPEEAPPLPLSSQAEAPRGWFSGLISGAGRILSSVFGSDSGGSSCSCSSDSDCDVCVDSDEDDHEDANRIDQPEKDLESMEDQVAGCQLLSSTSNTKHAIEQLLQQETYSRDESNRFMEIIQSRVAELPTENDKDAMPIGFPRATCCDVASARFLGSSKRNFLHERSPQSPSHLSTPYSSSFVDQAYLRDAAIMEAKKWVEEKKISPISKSSPSCGPCTLNTDTFHQESENDGGSPVDVAKSYMQALPPWRSPFISSIRFRTPPSSSSFERYESPYAIGDHLSASLEVLKRRSFAADPLDAVDTARNVRQKTGNSSLYSFGRSYSPLLAGSEEPQLLSAARDSIRTQTENSLGSTQKQPLEFSAKDVGTDRILNSPVTGAVEINPPAENGAWTETENTLDCDVETSEPHILTSEDQVHNESQALDHDTVAIENQVLDLKEASQVKEHFGIIAVADAPLLEHNGHLVEGVLDAEPIAVISGNTNCAFSSMCDEIPNTSEPSLLTSRRSSKLRQRGRKNKFSEDNPLLGTKDHDGNGQVQEPVDRSKFVTYSSSGSSSKLEAADRSIGSLKMGDKKKNTSYDKFGDDVPFETWELSSEALINDVEDRGNRTKVNKAQLGTTMKSIKQMLRELPPSPGRGRGRKAVAKGRRGRGRGK